MRKFAVPLRILLMITICLLLSSCRRKALSPEETEVEKEIKAQWQLVLDAIAKQDTEKFLSLCSENIPKQYSRERIDSYLKDSKESMKVRIRTDYEVLSSAFYKDMTEATITLKGKGKKDFIKEKGKWVLKDL
jgi:hypothetical protein